MKSAVAAIGLSYAVLLTLGCSADARDEGHEPGEDVGQVTQRWWEEGWDDTCDDYGAELLGVSRVFDGTKIRLYQWCSDGWVNRMGEWYPYSAPGAYPSIRGVGTKWSNRHVYAWYSDGTFSEGSSDNLGRYSNGKRNFDRPTKRDGSLWSMDELVEADCTAGDRWYYYWKDSQTGQVFLTVGSPSHGDAYATSQVVSVYPGFTILGIEFDPTSSPPNVLTYYKGYYDNAWHWWINVSNDGLNLAQY